MHEHACTYILSGRRKAQYFHGSLWPISAGRVHFYLYQGFVSRQPQETGAETHLNGFHCDDATSILSSPLDVTTLLDTLGFTRNRMILKCHETLFQPPPHSPIVLLSSIGGLSWKARSLPTKGGKLASLTWREQNIRFFCPLLSLAGTSLKGHPVLSSQETEDGPGCLWNVTGFF